MSETSVKFIFSPQGDPDRVKIVARMVDLIGPTIAMDTARTLRLLADECDRQARAAIRAAPPAEPSPRPALDEWVTAKEVGARFGLSPRWLQAHRRDLLEAGIARRVSHKVYVYAAPRLAKWIERRPR